MLRLKLDPWSADYGPSLHFEPEEACAEVDTSVEGEWRAHSLAAGPLPESVILIDGVRRMDLFLRWEDQARSLPAAAGSLAVGALLLRPGTSLPLSQFLQLGRVQPLLGIERRTFSIDPKGRTAGLAFRQVGKINPTRGRSGGLARAGDIGLVRSREIGILQSRW